LAATEAEVDSGFAGLIFTILLAAVVLFVLLGLVNVFLLVAAVLLLPAFLGFVVGFVAEIRRQRKSNDQ
jgi:hypothetical protein